MVIPYLTYYKDLPQAYKNKLESIGGIKILEDSCLGVSPRCTVGKKCLCCCKREGDHKKHTWMSEIMISDEVLLPVEKQKSSGKIDTHNALIKSMNLEVAYLKAAKKTGKTSGVELLKEALDLAEVNFFKDGKPKNLRENSGTSYLQILDAVDSAYKDLVTSISGNNTKAQEKATKGIEELTKIWAA